MARGFGGVSKNCVIVIFFFMFGYRRVKLEFLGGIEETISS